MHIAITLLLMDIHMELGLKVFRKQNFDRFPEGCKKRRLSCFIVEKRLNLHFNCHLS